MKKYLVFSFIAFSIYTHALAQPSKRLKVSEMNFNFTMGRKKADTFNHYSLIGMSYMSPPASNNARKLFADWMKKHPNAEVVPVCSFGAPPEAIGAPKDLLIMCWVIDKGDTLNNYLVKNGCLPGGTMFGYDEWQKLNTRLPKGQIVPKLELYVPMNVYKAYQTQIIENEKYAHSHKLGLWSDAEYFKIKDIEERSPQ